MLTKNKAGFTLVEMMIVTPIALLMIAGIITAIIRINNNTVIVNERAKKVADINRALKIIERDISLSNDFLAKVKLVDENNKEINSTNSSNASINSPFLSNSVYYGNVPLYLEKDKPRYPFKVKQPRLILNRLATITNPDSKNYLKKMSHFKNGPYNGKNCIYNNPVFLNVVYYIKNNNLYRRIVLHNNGVSKNYELISDMYCQPDNTDYKTKERPWQLSSCKKSDFMNNSGINNYPKYCKAKDELLVSQVEMDIKYMFKGLSKYQIEENNNIIHNSSKTVDQRNNILKKSNGSIVTLTSKIIMAEGEVETIVSNRIVSNKMFIKDSNVN